MKKRLEADLISIANRILKLKDKSEISILLFETRKIYEALLMLQFVEQNQNTIEPVINTLEVEAKIEASLNETNIETAQTVDDLSAEKSPPQPVLETKLPPSENVLTIAHEPQNPAILNKKPEIISEKTNELKKQQISFEELLGHQYIEPTFEKKQDKSTTLNDTFGKTINFGFNDRVGFIKNLFDGSDQDFTRVVSQIETFGSFAEVKKFIDDLVKPDYKNWENVTDYEARFMEIIERKFS